MAQTARMRLRAILRYLQSTAHQPSWAPMKDREKLTTNTSQSIM